MNFGIQHAYSTFNTSILNKRKIFRIIEYYSEVTNELKNSEVGGPDSECDNIWYEAYHLFFLLRVVC
jgi:hypothetical protein